jgi:hypothetical protein
VRGDLDLSDLWLEGDDGLGPSDMDGAPPRPAKGYVICSLAWLARVRLQVRSADQLLVAMVLYSRCLRYRKRTVDLSNGELRKLGISRYTKYRTLAELEETGAITIEETSNGCSVRVTLHQFP